MMTTHPYSKRPNVVIAGAGPAGLSAALWARRLGADALIVEQGSRSGGQLRLYSLPVVDLPGFGPASSDALAVRLALQVQQSGARILMGHSLVGWDGQTVRLDDGRRMDADWFFYAPGLRTRGLTISGHQWISARSVSDLIPGPSRRILMVGAGDRAVEGACRLASAGHFVTLVCRRDTLQARTGFVERLAQSTVEVWYQTVLTGLTQEDPGHVVAEMQQARRVVTWVGDEVLLRIGMEPDVNASLAFVLHDRAYPAALRMSVIGDAALPAADRSLVAAMADAMQSVKRSLQRLEVR